MAVSGGTLAAIVAAAAVKAGAPLPASGQAQHPFLTGLPPASLGQACLPAGHAFLRAHIRGAVRLDLDLHGAALRCQGGPRLDGSGIRMGFEGRVAPVGRLRMIFGIDGAKAGRSGRELPTNLTVMLEDQKRLYATQGDGNCTVDRLTQEPFGAAPAPTRPPGAAATARARPAMSRSWRIVAHGFCIAPVNDLSGRRRIVVTSFDFAGRLDFNSP
jgi:hypothetical protein